MIYFGHHSNTPFFHCLFCPTSPIPHQITNTNGHLLLLPLLTDVCNNTFCVGNVLVFAIVSHKVVVGRVLHKQEPLFQRRRTCNNDATALGGHRSRKPSHQH